MARSNQVPPSAGDGARTRVRLGRPSPALVGCGVCACRIPTGVVCLLVGITALACQSDYQFDTTAHYEAVRSRYELSVHATGIVRAGDDLSNRSHVDVIIAPLGAAGSRIQFSLARPDSMPRAAEIAKRVTDAGFTADSEELAETVRVVNGALAGPKATLMDGQTRVLRVVDVQFRR